MTKEEQEKALREFSKKYNDAFYRDFFKRLISNIKPKVNEQQTTGDGTNNHHEQQENSS